MTIEQELEFYLDNHPNCFALRVSDNGMQPLISWGAMLFVNPDRKPRTGKDVVVIRLGSNLVVCRLLKVGPNQLLMSFDNEKHQRKVVWEDKIQIVGTAFAAKDDDGWNLLDEELEHKIKDHQTAATVAV